MENSHKDYWRALERLKQRRPSNTKITKDAVAIEAGRQAGSIKKSRPSFAELIIAIDEAESAREHPPTPADKVKKARVTQQHYHDLYRQATNRELMQVCRIAELERHVKKLKGALSEFENVVPLFEVT